MLFMITEDKNSLTLARVVQECTDGIPELVRSFIDSAECCSKVADYEQGRVKPLMEYTQHYAQVFMLYGGHNMSSISDVLGSHASISQWADGLKSKDKSC